MKLKRFTFVSLFLMVALCCFGVASAEYSIEIDNMSTDIIKEKVLVETYPEGSANPGDTVQISISAEAGYEMDYLEVYQETDNGLLQINSISSAEGSSFVMPDGNVRVKVLYTALNPQIVATGTYGGDTAWTLDENGTLTVSGTGSLTSCQYGHYVVKVVIQSGITEIGDWAFAEMGISEVEMSDTVTKIGEYAFAQNDYLKRVVLSKSLTNISRGCFAACTKLTDLIIPSGVISIDDFALASTALATITIPSTVTSISAKAFNYDPALRYKYNTEFVVEDDNSDYSSQDGVLFNKDKTELVRFPVGRTGEYTIPDTVTTIGANAFASCGLSILTIPRSVTSIGDSYTFEFSELTDIYYCGTEEAWQAMIPDDLELPETTNLHFPIASGVCGAEGDNLTWTLDDLGTLTISGKGKMSAFNSYENPAPWKAYSADIQQVIVDIGVINIGQEAFSSLPALTRVTVPSSVTEIDAFAFNNCRVLSNVTFAEGLMTIGENAFSDCLSLRNITLPKSLTTIRLYAFALSSLESIVVPPNVVTIEDEVFHGCKNLKDISLPFPVWGFDWCFSIKTIHCGGPLSKAKTYFVTDAYLNGEIHTSTAFANVYCSNGAFGMCGSDFTWSYQDGSLETSGDSVFWRLDNQGVLTISGEGMIQNYSIANPAPWDASPFDIRQVTIESGISGIGDYAFYSCNQLESINYLGNEEQWEKMIIGFGNDCLDNVLVTYNYVSPFPSGTCGENLTWKLDEKGLLTISGEGEMEHYSNTNPAPWDYCLSDIQRVIIEDGVTGIGSGAFSDCTELWNVSIPESVKAIGWFAFSGCSNLTQIIIPDSVTEIHEYAFMSSGLTSLIIPDGVHIIEDGLLAWCSNLSSLSLPTIITSIGKQAFSNTNLTSFRISDSVTTVGDDAFQRCRSLTTLIVPQSITSIGDRAFSGCSKLSDVRYAGTPEQWEFINIGTENDYLLNAYREYGFEGSIVIKDGMCGENLTWTLDVDGVLTVIGNGPMIDYAYRTTPWYDDCQMIKKVVIGSEVTSIGDYAFAMSHNLAQINLPETLISIGKGAFQACNNLSILTIPLSTIEIKTGAFEACSAMITGYYGTQAYHEALNSGNTFIPVKPAFIPGFILPQGVKVIEEETFSGIAATAIKLPEGAETIGSRGFAECGNLKQIYIPASVTSISSDAFKEDDIILIYGMMDSEAYTYACDHINCAFVPVDE